MPDFKMNLKFRSKLLSPVVTKPNRIIPSNNTKFANIKSVHNKIIEDNLIRKAGTHSVGLAMAYACAGKKIYGANCGCGR